MKKVSSILVVCLLMFLSVYSVSAEEVTLSPILFRGIEWGTSYSEVLTKLPTEMKFYDLKSDSNYTISNSMLGESKDYFDGHVVGYTYARSSSLEGIKVAGQELSGLRLRFAWVPGDDGLIVEDNDHTALFFAEYEIAPKDLDSAYADLTMKLSSLYGKPTATKTDGYIIDETYTVWYGGNKTMLVLLSKKYSSGSKEILIRYGTTEGDEWLQKAYDALILKETLEAASNVDGL